MRDRLTEIAKNLRRRSTDAEKMLWQRLRAKQLDGLKFRRQEPIGHYVLDFICYEKNLVVKVGGGQHATKKEYDEERNNWFRQQGFKALRFWNNEVLTNIGGVLEAIRENCIAPSSLSPPIKGGGNKRTLTANITS